MTEDFEDSEPGLRSGSCRRDRPAEVPAHVSIQMAPYSQGWEVRPDLGQERRDRDTDRPKVGREEALGRAEQAGGSCI